VKAVVDMPDWSNEATKRIELRIGPLLRNHDDGNGSISMGP
jgi:hypothetical protein